MLNFTKLWHLQPPYLCSNTVVSRYLWIQCSTKRLIKTGFILLTNDVAAFAACKGRISCSLYRFQLLSGGSRTICVDINDSRANLLKSSKQYSSAMIFLDRLYISKTTNLRCNGPTKERSGSSLLLSSVYPLACAYERDYRKSSSRMDEKKG
jgi:hypothetical protein